MAATYYPSAFNAAYRGIPNDETGIIVQSISQTFTPKNDTLEDKQGRVVGLARLIDCTRKIEVSGIINGTTEMGSNSISFAAGVTVAGKLNYHGFTANHPIVVEDISYDEGNNAWKGVKISLVSYLGISAA